MSATPPRVSVQVMVYNSDAFLEKCLTSLKEQTFRDFEVLMVDAASKDGSAAICRSFAQTDSRFVYIAHPDCRVSEARNEAVKRSRGALVAILDSDDWSYPDRLALQVAWFDAYPDTTLLGGYYRVINRWGIPLRIKPIHFTEDVEIRWRLTFGNCLTHSTVMFRREAALKAGNYNPATRAGEDIEFYSRLLQQGEFRVTPQPLSASRVHSTSLSRTEPREWERDFITSVQQSIRLQLGIETDTATAEAVYNQSSAAAASPAIFRQGLTLIQKGHDFFVQHHVRTSRERKLLGRSVFLHLLQFMTKNEQQSWWHDVDCEWLQMTRALCAVPGYDWRRDLGLIFQIKPILKTSWRAIWLLCVR